MHFLIKSLKRRVTALRFFISKTGFAWERGTYVYNFQGREKRKFHDYVQRSPQRQPLVVKGAGLLSKILSLPPEWDFTLSGLAKITSDGVDSVRSAIRELEKFGYITRKQLRDERGRMSQNEYHVYEDPKQNPDFSEQPDNIFLASPLSELPSAENPSTVNPTTDTYYILNTNKSNTYLSITQSRAPRGSAEKTEDREKYFSLIRENIEFDDLAEKEKVTELVEVMTDVICSNRRTIRVNVGELPIEQVRKRFLELRREHIENVLKTLKSNSTSGKFEMQSSSFDVDDVMRRIMARYEKIARWVAETFPCRNAKLMSGSCQFGY